MGLLNRDKKDRKKFKETKVGQFQLVTTLFRLWARREDAGGVLSATDVPGDQRSWHCFISVSAKVNVIYIVTSI